MSIAQQQTTLQEFFDALFGDDRGYVVIATTRPVKPRETFKEEYFEWPAQRDDMTTYIEKVTPSHNVYFCVNLLSVPRRKKENAIPQKLLWSDLDTCSPAKLEIPPQLVIESSPQRYQGIWFIEEKLDPLIAQNYSKRIAYKYHEFGADKSGHDLTQLLRVPTTYNFKYDEPYEVRLLSLLRNELPIALFAELPQVDIEADDEVGEVPTEDELAEVEQIIYRYQEELKGTTFVRYYAEEPTADWSKALWRLINLCIDIGMTPEETFVIARTSKCNKYARDGRPISHLWREVKKAELQHKLVVVTTGESKHLKMPQLLTAAEREGLEPTLIDEYCTWARDATDASPVFHEISAMILLSSLMSAGLRMDTKNASVVPNLWALLLGDSTLTRKTTSMNLALEFIYDIERDLVLAGDASPEGLMQNLSLRPKMVSIFHRDEVTGFFSSIQKKEYLSAMPEIMTKMYDVPKYLPRTLRKETFIVSEPIFIFYGGGVPDKMYELVSEEYYLSGFIPRFLVVEARGDIESVRPTGPPTDTDNSKRADLLETFYALYDMYSKQEIIVDLGGEKIRDIAESKVVFTDEMWNRAMDIEMLLLRTARESYESAKGLPTFSRMFFSMLKITMLLAAARSLPGEDRIIRAEMRDLLTAMYYIERWGKHTVNFVRNSGMGASESKMMSIYRFVENNPGTLRGEIMNRFRCNAREMSILEDTLVQRLQIEVRKKGGGTQYWPIGR